MLRLFQRKEGRSIICFDVVIIMAKGQGATADPRKPRRFSQGGIFFPASPIWTHSCSGNHLSLRFPRASCKSALKFTGTLFRSAATPDGSAIRGRGQTSFSQRVLFQTPLRGGWLSTDVLRGSCQGKARGCSGHQGVQALWRRHRSGVPPRPAAPGTSKKVLLYGAD